MPKFEDLPAQAGSKKNLSPQQMLPKPIITTLKNNPTMNLMEFTFKPYTKVIFFSSCYIDLQFNCTLVPIYFFIFILFTLFIFDYYYN